MEGGSIENMSLDLSKLERVRYQDGSYTARCPACAEHGGDARGDNHLIVFADDRFGCAANANDLMHRKRIFELVGLKDGQRQHRPIPLPSVSPPPTPKTAAKSIVASLSRGFGTLATGILKSRARTKENESAGLDNVQGLETTRSSRADSIPYRDRNGDLHIPFDSPVQYHWWKAGGMRLGDIRRQFPFSDN
jgi:hypothetical protein